MPTSQPSLFTPVVWMRKAYEVDKPLNQEHRLRRQSMLLSEMEWLRRRSIMLQSEMKR